MRVARVIGLFLMGLYQYGVYSTLWIGEEHVRDVKQASHIAGDIGSIECIKVTRKNGSDTGKFQVVLKTGEILVFLSRGTIKNCEKFYDKFGDVFAHKKVDKGDLQVTHVYEQFYKQIIFDGYFIGKIPLHVSFDDHVWMPYKDMKRHHRNFVLWLSLGPIIFVLFVWLIRLNRIKMKET